ncbi:MAG: hypothetical protein Q9170_007261 [Blastenia crenularia]
MPARLAPPARPIPNITVTAPTGPPNGLTAPATANNPHNHPFASLSIASRQQVMVSQTAYPWRFAPYPQHMQMPQAGPSRGVVGQVYAPVHQTPRPQAPAPQVPVAQMQIQGAASTPGAGNGVSTSRQAGQALVNSGVLAVPRPPVMAHRVGPVRTGPVMSGTVPEVRRPDPVTRMRSYGPMGRRDDVAPGPFYINIPRTVDCSPWLAQSSTTSPVPGVGRGEGREYAANIPQAQVQDVGTEDAGSEEALDQRAREIENYSPIWAPTPEELENRGYEIDGDFPAWGVMIHPDPDDGKNWTQTLGEFTKSMDSWFGEDKPQKKSRKPRK